MKNQFGLITLCFTTAILPGCSYVQSFFPDKERDYQYTAEIPMINWPAELRKNQTGSNASETPMPLTSNAGGSENSSDDSAERPPADNVSDVAVPQDMPSAKPEISTTEIKDADESERDVVSSVEIVKYDDGESRLRLGAGFSKSWRVVNKALSHNTIEVTERNYDQAVITIQYDPNEKKVKDDSFMDEVDFILKGIDINDHVYVLKLEQHNQQTDVIVLNEEHLPILNDDASLGLLKVLANSIKADLPNKTE